MEPWVSERLKTFLPTLARLSSEEEIAALCEGEIQALRERGLGSILSYKRPLRELRNAVKALAETGNQYDIALTYLSLTEEEKIAINQPSERKRDERLTQQAFIRRPGEVVDRIARLLQSSRWDDLAAGLSAATGRRLAEVVRFAVFREKSAYSVLFAGQRKSENAPEYEIATLAPASLVIDAWRRLRKVRDFSAVASDSISANFGPAVKAVIVREFSDLVEALPGRAELYTHMLRAVYPRLAIHFFLPPRVQEIAFANAILGHVANQNGDLIPNYQSTLYYLSYKILNEDGSIDGREGIRLSEPGVEVLDQFKERKQTMMADVAEKETKIRVDRINKAEFDSQQQLMETKSANETIGKLLSHNAVYLQLAELIEDVPALVDVLREAVDIKLENETPLEALSAAISDKRRFRATYEKRSAANADKDYSDMTLSELAKTRTPEASIEKWRRGVDLILQYNNNASMPELMWYVNAASVKALVGGRGTEIKKYLQTRQAELDEHHKQHKLTPGRNHGRTNIRERILGENAASMPEEED